MCQTVTYEYACVHSFTSTIHCHFIPEGEEICPIWKPKYRLGMLLPKHLDISKARNGQVPSPDPSPVFSAGEPSPTEPRPLVDMFARPPTVPSWLASEEVRDRENEKKEKMMMKRTMKQERQQHQVTQESQQDDEKPQQQNGQESATETSHDNDEHDMVNLPGQAPRRQHFSVRLGAMVPENRRADSSVGINNDSRRRLISPRPRGPLAARRATSRVAKRITSLPRLPVALPARRPIQPESPAGLFKRGNRGVGQHTYSTTELPDICDHCEERTRKADHEAWEAAMMAVARSRGRRPSSMSTHPGWVQQQRQQQQGGGGDNGRARPVGARPNTQPANLGAGIVVTNPMLTALMNGDVDDENISPELRTAILERGRFHGFNFVTRGHGPRATRFSGVLHDGIHSIGGLDDMFVETRIRLFR